MKTFSESKTTVSSDPTHGNGALKRALDLCVLKTRANIKDLADNPGTWASAVDGDYSKWDENFYEIGNWTSSFFTGMALLAWRETEDEYFLKQVLRLAPHYREKVFTRFLDTHHDLGFLYSLYSVVLFKLTGDKKHREVGLRAAEILYQRFNDKCGFIRAWGHMNTAEQDNMAIIDCMMNLPLLYWAAAESGDRKYHEAANRHAEMTLRCFIRPDDSVFHAFRFDLKSGQPIGGDNYCGHSVDSHWARGTGWAIYGFALSYRYTGKKEYLDASVRLARKFNQELNGDAIPVWDFRLSKGEKPLRDSSAAAVLVCGYQELENLKVDDTLTNKTKESLLHHLCSDAYLNLDQSCRGILRDGQIGSNDTLRAVYTSWGDYFLMEALARELFKAQTWW
ncbi:MAG TPA: glycoside hydrolase family 88 protein [Verrucomicrobiae bacterium]|jgi:unsaturated chondroitin disaccharide hydrolase